MAEKLSVTIITLNEEKNIARCLDAVIQIADEIIIVDSFSSDRTKEICLEYGAKFTENKFEGYIEQKKYAATLVSNDWVLSLDADEVLSNELISSIRRIKANPIHNAYTVNRLSFYVDRFIYHGHWFPDKKIRMFRRGAGTWIGRNPHDQFVLTKSGRAPLLPGVVYHYTFNSISEHMLQADKFSEIGAIELREQNLFFLLIKAIFSPFWNFFYGYFFRLGFLDGWYGLIISIVSTVETFLKYAKSIVYKYSLKADLKDNKEDFGISLIISTYNWPEALEQSLKSVNRQTRLPNEVIIADDGSSQETRDLIEKFQKDFPVPLKHSWIEDRGFRLSKSRNEAIKQAKFQYIVQIDGDIYMHDNFIKDHAEFAKPETFVRGSRVLLSQSASEKLFASEISSPTVFMRGITNFFNGIRAPILRNMLASQSKSILGIRGCNMAYWRCDAIKVNGYNEEIVGWGREDSEFVARLLNLGVTKRTLRFGGIEYHIYHKEYDRKLLNKNDRILNYTVDNKLITCENGIVKEQEALIKA